jgi:hypothetical protein
MDNRWKAYVVGIFVGIAIMLLDMLLMRSNVSWDWGAAIIGGMALYAVGGLFIERIGGGHR